MQCLEVICSLTPREPFEYGCCGYHFPVPVSRYPANFYYPVVGAVPAKLVTNQIQYISRKLVVLSRQKWKNFDIFSSNLRLTWTGNDSEVSMLCESGEQLDDADAGRRRDVVPARRVSARSEHEHHDRREHVQQGSGRRGHPCRARTVPQSHHPLQLSAQLLHLLRHEPALPARVLPDGHAVAPLRHQRSDDDRADRYGRQWAQRLACSAGDAPR